MTLRMSEDEYVIFVSESHIYYFDEHPELTFDTKCFLVFETPMKRLEYFVSSDHIPPGYPFSPKDYFSNAAIPFFEIEFVDKDKEEVRQKLKKEYIKLKMERDLKK